MNWASSEGRSRQKSRRLKSRITFDLSSAHATLPLVKRIVADLVESTRCAAKERSVTLRERAQTALLFQVRSQSSLPNEAVTDRVDELRRLGVVVLDNVRGVVAFPSIVNGCLAYLIFQHGNESIDHWRFRDQGKLRPVPTSWQAA